jgi:hypothetical protein
MASTESIDENPVSLKHVTKGIRNVQQALTSTEKVFHSGKFVFLWRI